MYNLYPPSNYKDKSHSTTCNICDYKASTKGHLAEHRMAIHEEVKYKCRICDYDATQKGNHAEHRHS